MTVEHAETPGRQHEDSGAGKKHPDQPDGQGVLLRRESRRDSGREGIGGGHAGKNDYGGDAGEQPKHRIGQLHRFLVPALRSEAGVHRDERGRQDAFAKQVLQKIGNTEGRVERVRAVGEAEIVCQCPLAQQADQPAEENTRADEAGGPGGSTQDLGGGGSDARACPSSRRRCRN